MAPDSNVTGLDFIPDLEAVCITTDLGDVLLYSNKQVGRSIILVNFHEYG
jgi:hypothetical protein